MHKVVMKTHDGNIRMYAVIAIFKIQTMPCEMVERLPLKRWTVCEIPVLQN